MSLNIECEDRVMISEANYYDVLTPLLRRSNEHPFILQTNIYIDTDDLLLKENHMVLRIRVIQPFFVEFTLKVKGNDGDKEYTQPLDFQSYQLLKERNQIPEGEVKDKLKEILKTNDFSFLKQITSLDTRRYEEKIDDYLLVLDKNSYNGIEDYNLEIEAPSIERAKQVMQEYCKTYGIEYKPCKSKSRRAFDSIKK